MDRDAVLEKIRRLKRLPFGSTRLARRHGGTPFSLVLLTEDRSSDIELIRLLSDWRSRHEHWFQAVFKITPEGTALWYRTRLIDAPDRILFMVEAEGAYLGHVGLFRFDFSDGTCEIDNIVRGVARHPGIMEAAIRLMMDWGEEELGVRGYRLETFADNERSLRLYERLGFRETKRIPLIRTEVGERIEWLEGPETPGAVVRYNVHMKRAVADA